MSPCVMGCSGKMMPKLDLVLREELADILQVDITSITDDKLLIELGVDSLHLVEMVVSLEEVADTIIDATEETLEAGTATGVKFNEPTTAALANAIERVLLLYEQPELWKQMQLTGMRTDYSWKNSAQNYTRLYEELVSQTQTHN